MSDSDADDGEISVGKRLMRVDDKGLSLGERIANHLHRLTWRTPLHNLRLRGRYPLKLIAVPSDPVPGDPDAGQALIAGTMRFAGQSVALDEIDFVNPALSAAFAGYLHGFAWLRDLTATGDRLRAAPVAEKLMRTWLARHGELVSDTSWTPEYCARRIMFWAAHAPLILSSTDLVYRSAVLNALARNARHLDRNADRASEGIARIVAWAGVVAAGLLIPGGDPRRDFGEAGLTRALAAGLSADGGSVSRNPLDQITVVETLAMLVRIYDARRIEAPAGLSAAQQRAVAALLGVTLGDGALSSWQGATPLTAARIAQVVDASGIRTRPLRQARDWGYQRMAGGASVVVFDAAPPPASRLGGSGCASTLAFELSDAERRLVVNCGGGRGSSAIPADLAKGLRTTAAHSTLVLAERNSTAVNADGTLGQGVREVELDRQELDSGSRIEATHDGYGKRLGIVHKRTLSLSSNGRELRGDDALIPVPRRRRTSGAAFAVRFHLAPGVEATPTADGQGALLRIAHGPLWQFRCRGGALSIEDSLWVDGAGRPHATVQCVISGEAPAGGASISWLFKRAG